MAKSYLWQEADFPHFYHNPAVVKPLEAAFKEEVKQLNAKLKREDPGFDDDVTEELVSNSEIEGVLLNRDSVHSSFLENITPAREKEQGAVALPRMAVDHSPRPLSHY